MLKPKPRRQRVQQPGLSSEEVAKWEGAPVTTQLPRGTDDSTKEAEVANGISSGQGVRMLYVIRACEYFRIMSQYEWFCNHVLHFIAPEHCAMTAAVIVVNCY